MHYFDFYSHFLHFPMVKGCAMWFSVVCESPLTTAQSGLLNSWYHLSPLTELISIGLSPQVCPPADTQPFGLLSWVEGTLSLGHYACSTWNHATACKAHEIDNLSGASGLCPNSTSWGILAEPHSVSPPNGLHIPAPFLSSLVTACKNFALKHWKMPWCHIQIPIYLLFLMLGIVDLDTKPGQPWLHVMTMLSSPWMSHLCDFASHSSLQMPIAQMRPIPSGWSLH